jgi:hypothetical protein
MIVRLVDIGTSVIVDYHCFILLCHNSNKVIIWKIKLRYDTSMESIRQCKICHEIMLCFNDFRLSHRKLSIFG